VYVSLSGCGAAMLSLLLQARQHFSAAQPPPRRAS
jgi:hypothetical protein